MRKTSARLMPWLLGALAGALLIVAALLPLEGGADGAQGGQGLLLDEADRMRAAQAGLPDYCVEPGTGLARLKSECIEEQAVGVGED